MVALPCLHPLDLVIQAEARLAAHRLESVMLDLPSPQEREQQYIDAALEVGFLIKIGSMLSGQH